MKYEFYKYCEYVCSRWPVLCYLPPHSDQVIAVWIELLQSRKKKTALGLGSFYSVKPVMR
jgi:hypothetical protein